jgi:hypothetical protein
MTLTGNVCSRILLILTYCVSSILALGANAIQIENALAGSSQWILTNPATSREIEGFASLASVNVGGQIAFYVNTADPTYQLEIYRFGWYGGLGGRNVLSAVQLTGVRQPMPTPDSTTGLIECRWTSPYTVTVPLTWTSGVFLVKLTGSSGKQSYIIFVVRDDNRSSTYLFQSSVNTYQAYNNWGGKSLYDFNSTSGRARKVSFNRPYGVGAQAVSASGVGAGDFLTTGAPASETLPAGWECNMVRFLERSGYDVTYNTDVDTHENAATLLNHTSFLSVGHNEYWSWQMRANVTAARDAGINLAFFGADAVYWQVRYEASPVTGAADRTVVCYKDTTDPVTGLLQTVLFQQLNYPEDALIGITYATDAVNAGMTLKNTTHWVFAGTGAHDGTVLPGLVGYEVDVLGSDPPANLVQLAHSTFSKGSSDMTIYTAPSGAQVFATGSLQWNWGLDDYNVPSVRPSVLSPTAQQVTRNVLARFAQSYVVTPANATLAATQSKQFTATQNGSAASVVWSATPAQGTMSQTGLYTAPSSVSATQTVLVTAANPADPTKYTAAMVVLTPPGGAGFTPIRINAGGLPYTDALNQPWLPDTGFAGGSTFRTTTAIHNTTAPTLYQTIRYGTFSYQFSVPAGNYQVNLKFAEIFYTTTGARQFNVAINGTTVLSNFDIVAAAGGAFTAIDKSFQVATSGGSIAIQFTLGSADSPQVNAIEIVASSGGPPPPPPPPPPPSGTVRVNAGGPGYADPLGQVWSADTGFIGGSTFATGTAIQNTTTPQLYQDIRYGAFTYQFAVPSGNYQVNLKFAEIFYTTSGVRKFNVSINGASVLSNFDIVAAAGSAFKAVDRSFQVTTTGSITIQFTVGSADAPQINAIEIVPSSSGPPPPPPPPANIVRVDVGGQGYTDSLGQVWSADTGFAGGTVFGTSSNIQNTTAVPLYQTIRYGAFTYQFSVPSGNYRVNLKFAEIYYTTAGARKFNVAINGASVLSNFDIVAAAGGGFTAVDRSFAVIASSGTITIQFTLGGADDPQVNAIEIVPQ